MVITINFFMKDNFNIDANVTITHIRNGKVIGEYAGHNLTTNAGKAGVAARINGYGSPAAYTYVGIGTGTTAAAATDTTLQTEIASGGGSRAAGTLAIVTTTVANDTAQVSYLFTFSSSFTVSETAVFNAASGGTMLNRYVFTGIPVASGDQLQFIHQFKQA